MERYPIYKQVLLLLLRISVPLFYDDNMMVSGV
jgi:hypothetical protein